MRILRYELEKLFRRKSVLLLLPAMMILSCVLIMSDNGTPRTEDWAVEKEYEEQTNYHNSYPDFIASMRQKAEEMQKASIFNKPNTFAFRNTQKTPEDFAPLEGIPLTPGSEQGLDALVHANATDFFVVAILLLCSLILFSEEKENKLNLLTRAAKNGKLPLVLCKLSALVIVAAVVSLLYYGSNMLTGQLYYGYGGLDRMIQSLPLFRDMTLPVTIGAFLPIYLGTKLLAAVSVALLFALLLQLSPDTPTAYGLIAAGVGLSAALYMFVPPLSPLNVLKYVNLFALFDVYRLYAYYINLNLFGFAVSRLPVTLVFFGMASVLIAGLVCRLYCKTDAETGKKGFVTLLLGLVKPNTQKLRGRALLIPHELYKLFVIHKGWMVCAAALMLCYTQIETDEKLYSQQDYQYIVFARQLEGPIGPETDRLMEDWHDRYGNLGAEYEKAQSDFFADKITVEEYGEIMAEIGDFGGTWDAFSRVQEQYEKLKFLGESTGIPVHFVNEINTDALFDTEKRDLLNGVLFAVLLALMLCNLFPYESKKDMTKLVAATMHGQRRLAMVKLGIALSFTLLLYVAVYIPEILNMVNTIRFSDWDAPIQSAVTRYGTLDAQLSMLGFILLRHILGMAFSLSASVLFCAISVRLRRSGVTLAICCLLFAAPFGIALLGVDAVKRYSLCAAYDFYAVMNGAAGLVPVLAVTMGVVVIGAVCGGLTCASGKMAR